MHSFVLQQIDVSYTSDSCSSVYRMQTSSFSFVFFVFVLRPTMSEAVYRTDAIAEQTLISVCKSIEALCIAK